MSARPFRNLCPEAEMRDAMTSDEFWVHIFREGDDEPEPEPESTDSAPCSICGEPGACAYDDDGLPLIHALPSEDDS